METIRATVTAWYVPDCHTLRFLEAGKEYQFNNTNCHDLVRRGWAEYVRPYAEIQRERIERDFAQYSPAIRNMLVEGLC